MAKELMSLEGPLTQLEIDCYVSYIERKLPKIEPKMDRMNEAKFKLS